MRREKNPEWLEKQFALIVRAALAGERCPISHPHGPLDSGAVSALVDQGRIRSEVYSLNYRVITILKGEHRGRRTRACPHSTHPYLVNGVHVDRIIQRRIGR